MFPRILSIVLEHAPAAIALAEKFLARGENDRKRLAAAREVVEVLKNFKNNAGQFGLNVSGIDETALFEAMKDEVRFTEEVAKLNDALVVFSNYVREYKPVTEF